MATLKTGYRLGEVGGLKTEGLTRSCIDKADLKTGKRRSNDEIQRGFKGPAAGPSFRMTREECLGQRIGMPLLLEGTLLWCG